MSEQNKLTVLQIADEIKGIMAVRIPVADLINIANYAQGHAAQQVEHATAELRKELEQLSKALNKYRGAIEYQKSKVVELQKELDQISMERDTAISAHTVASAYCIELEQKLIGAGAESEVTAGKCLHGVSYDSICLVCLDESHAPKSKL